MIVWFKTLNSVACASRVRRTQRGMFSSAFRRKSRRAAIFDAEKQEALLFRETGGSDFNFKRKGRK